MIMYSNKGNSISELWAVLDKYGNVMMSRGGSSSTPKIMVYPTEKKAKAAINNNWTKQVINPEDVTIKQIYSV